MFCKNCGKEIDNTAVVCPHCGVQQKNNPAIKDDGGLIWSALGCCIPIAGLILYLIWKNDKPKTAKAAAFGALVAIGAIVLIHIVYVCIIVVTRAGLASAY